MDFVITIASLFLIPNIFRSPLYADDKYGVYPSIGSAGGINSYSEVSSNVLFSIGLRVILPYEITFTLSLLNPPPYLGP